MTYTLKCKNKEEIINTKSLNSSIIKFIKDKFKVTNPIIKYRIKNVFCVTDGYNCDSHNRIYIVRIENEGVN